MTKNESRVLRYIADFIDRHGYSPSFQEIADHLDFKSPSQTYGICMRLIEKGKLKKGKPKEERSLEII